MNGCTVKNRNEREEGEVLDSEPSDLIALKRISESPKGVWFG